MNFCSYLEFFCSYLEIPFTTTPKRNSTHTCIQELSLPILRLASSSLPLGRIFHLLRKSRQNFSSFASPFFILCANHPLKLPFLRPKYFILCAIRQPSP